MIDDAVSDYAKDMFVRLGENYNISLVEWMVKLKQHREIPAHHVIKSCTITKTKTGKYFISILVEYEHQPVEKEIRNVIGIDFSVNSLYVDSEGKKAITLVTIDKL